MRTIYGINPVREALRSSTAEKIKTLYIYRERQDHTIKVIEEVATGLGIDIRRVDKARLGSVAGTSHHQGVVALVRGEFPYREPEDIVDIWQRSGERAFILLLDSVEDPVNLGSIVRSAHCAGVQGIIIPRRRAAGVTPTVVKSSAGATEHTPIALTTNLTRTARRLKERGIWLVGLEADTETSIYDVDLTMDVALVVGGEARGIRRVLRGECDILCHIPMRGKLNSLNAAQASTVALFETLRQRTAKKE